MVGSEQDLPLARDELNPQMLAHEYFMAFPVVGGSKGSTVRGRFEKVLQQHQTASFDRRWKPRRSLSSDEDGSGEIAFG